MKGPEPAAKVADAAKASRKLTQAEGQKPLVSNSKPIKLSQAAAGKATPVKSAALETAPRAAKPTPVDKPAKLAATDKPAKEKIAKVETKPESKSESKAAAIKPAPGVDTETTTASVDPGAKSVGEASDKPEFRWPARGRVIQGFKTGSNDGINIALPEGTSVKAAEGGVVAYAGSELKGYGNMVLIRHPNGYVSAYANNGDVAVKKGDKVTRGQTIAKSGQTGNVASPQLHFELRKGSTPVDPTNYLAGL